MAKSKKTEATEIMQEAEYSVVTDKVGAAIQTDPAVINPYVAELKWRSAQPINHAGLMYTYPKVMFELEGKIYDGYENVLLATPALERIYTLPLVTFELLFGRIH